MSIDLVWARKYIRWFEKHEADQLKAKEDEAKYKNKFGHLLSTKSIIQLTVTRRIENV